MTTCNFYQSKQLNYLKSLSSSERARMEGKSQQISIPKGVIIFFESEQLQKLFCIEKGVCKFSKMDDKGKEHILQLLGKGELMGRRSIITNKGARVTATALTDTQLCSVAKKAVLSQMKNNNGFCMDVLKGFIDDTEQDELQKTLFLNHKGIQSRLAGLLFYLKQKFGTDKDNFLKVKLKREEVADMLGTSGEYVIKLLGSLKRQNYIELLPQGIKITSDKKLLELI